MQWVEGRGLKTKFQIKTAGSCIGGMHHPATRHTTIRLQTLAKSHAIFRAPKKNAT